MSERTYTISITYETTITTTASKEDIENALWTGENNIGLLSSGLGRDTHIRAGAVDYDIEVDEE